MNLLQNFVYSFGLNLNSFDPINLNQTCGLNQSNVNEIKNSSPVNFDSINNFKTNTKYQTYADQQMVSPPYNECLNNEQKLVAVEENANTSSDSMSSDLELSPTTTPNTLNDKFSPNGSFENKKENFFPLIENKRIRNMFSTNQIEILEKVFEQTHYPDSSIREQLSSRLNLNVMRIQVWFQNRRAKYRKMDIEQRKSNSSINKKQLKLSNSITKVKKEEKTLHNLPKPSILQAKEKNTLKNSIYHEPYSSILKGTNLIGTEMNHDDVNRQLIASSYQFQNTSNLFDFQMAANQQVSSIFPHYQGLNYQPTHNHQQFQHQQHHYQAYLQSKQIPNHTNEQLSYEF